MELLHWTQVDRKRSNSIRHDDPSFVRGYDLDMDDFTVLVAKYNAEQLSRPEENRLLDYVMTMLNIVLENPKINPTPEEIPGRRDVHGRVGSAAPYQGRAEALQLHLPERLCRGVRVLQAEDTRPQASGNP